MVCPPKSFSTAGVQASASMGPVALAIKPIPPSSLAMTCPAARVCAVTVPGFTAGIARLGGPPGLDPPMATFRARAAGLVSTQLRKKAAQSACLAVAEMP